MRLQPGKPRDRRRRQRNAARRRQLVLAAGTDRIRDGASGGAATAAAGVSAPAGAVRLPRRNGPLVAAARVAERDGGASGLLSGKPRPAGVAPGHRRAGWPSTAARVRGQTSRPSWPRPAQACMLYPAQTLGPCYAQMPASREDISEGQLGLPLRLSFLVVRSDGCTPVPNASVDIWHSGVDGIYSAFNTGTICNPGTMNVRSEMFCRGVQTTGEDVSCRFQQRLPAVQGPHDPHSLHVNLNGRASVPRSCTSRMR